MQAYGFGLLKARDGIIEVAEELLGGGVEGVAFGVCEGPGLGGVFACLAPGGRGCGEVAGTDGAKVFGQVCYAGVLREDQGRALRTCWLLKGAYDVVGFLEEAVDLVYIVLFL